MNVSPQLRRELVAAMARGPRRRSRTGLIIFAPTATAAAAAAVLLIPSERPGDIPADERPIARPTISRTDTQEAPLRALKSPEPAPPALAASYSALADGKVHEGPKVAGATVTVHGNRSGGCIWVLFDGDQGPGGSCFTEQNVNATSGVWSTTGDVLIVLVPDAATDISIEDSDGTRRPATATSNLVAGDRGDTVRYSVSGKQVTVRADG